MLGKNIKMKNKVPGKLISNELLILLLVA